MSATICPTITAVDPNDYRLQMQRVVSFSRRLHIDLMDGAFASPRSVDLGEIYWPANIPVDLHVMYKKPFVHAQALIALRPQMIIIHAEADGDFVPFADLLHSHGMEVGVALLPQTPSQNIIPALESVDHVLIFSGNLGHQGGTANLQLLSKVPQIRRFKPSVEIGWDGGVSPNNARELAAGGIDVLNVGGAIQHAVNPSQAYATLESLV